MANKYLLSLNTGASYELGEEPPYTYNITLTKVNGVAAALNRIIDLINEQE